ncbi:MAG: FAD-dependent monooxygenase [Pseudomonadota bacterium]
MPEQTSRQARIIGGGIAGLATAIALTRVGWQVTVEEQAPAFTEVGAGLQISPNGARALMALDLFDTVAEKAFRPEAAVMRDGISGFEVLRVPLGEAAVSRWGAPYLHLHRADLMACLAQAAEALGVNLKAGVKVEPGTFQTGEGLPLTIIAAGARSGFAKRKPEFTGQVAWRALVPSDRLPSDLIAPEATVWAGSGRHVVTYYLRGGALVNIVAVEEREEWAKESWSEPGDPDQLRAAFAGWHPAIETLLEKVDTCFLWGLHDRPVMLVLHPNNTVLIGDAAHHTLPFLAQGAAMGMEDAVTLAQCLEGREVPVALARYTALRRDRVARVYETSRRNAELFHMRDPLQRVLSRGPMVLASRLLPGVAAAQLDWLYGFDVMEAP